MYTTDMNKPTKYEINEKDIDTVLSILKRTDPENATPEAAIAYLEDMQAELHRIGHDNPEKLEELMGEIIKQKKNKEKLQTEG